MEPAHALLAEERLPVDLAGLELGDGREAAVGAGTRAAAAIAALDEVEAVADLAADTVERAPEDVAHVDAALEHEVLDETADRIVRERGDRRRLETEAAAQAAHDVVLAAAFPDLELAGGVDAPVARIEAEHDFTEGRRVPLTRTGRLDVKGI